MKRFLNKSAIVTAAANGIGRATAERLAAEGADVFLADIDADAVAKLAESLQQQHGVTVCAVRFDAADAESCKRIVSHAIAALGKIDIVCNIAGIQQWNHFSEITDETWNRLVAINLNCAFYILREAMPHLEKTQGCVVNIASTAALNGIAYNAPYCATKAALVGLTKTIAVEYAARGVRCNAVAPGGVKAGQAKSDFPEGADMELILRLSPKTGEMCEPSEIAAAVAYLASDEAKYITGSVLVIDGGQTAG